MKILLGFITGTIINLAFILFLDWANGYLIPPGIWAQLNYPAGGWLSLLVIMTVVYTMCLYGVYTVAWATRKLKDLFRRKEDHFAHRGDHRGHPGQDHAVVPGAEP